MRVTTQLRQLLKTGQPLFVPGCYNALAVALCDEGPLAEARSAERFARHPLGDLHTFAGFDRIREWEARYLPPEELDKYAGSIGHQPARE